MRALVTGAAGFIGSTLVDRLLAEGHDVVGVDAFTDYYDPDRKRANLDEAAASPAFTLVELDLATDDLAPLLEVDAVFHLAGQPGVRPSWGEEFVRYVTGNVVATQRLLEAFRARPITRFVNSSSSSVYGDAERFPTPETAMPAPVSPYGVTKLAAEHLCTLYGTSYGVPTVSLRYFTVYGPRQRPDMAMEKLIAVTLAGEAFPRYGDGSQVRDFTFVGDVAAANVLAATGAVPAGTVMNIGGGEAATLAEVIAIVERLAGRSVTIEALGSARGDARRTSADTSRARDLLGWVPQVSVAEGLERQVAWHLARQPS